MPYVSYARTMSSTDTAGGHDPPYLALDPLELETSGRGAPELGGESVEPAASGSDRLDPSGVDAVGSDAATAAAAQGAPSNVATSGAPATALSRRAETQISRPEIDARENKRLAEGPTRAGKTGSVSAYAGGATPTALCNCACLMSRRWTQQPSGSSSG